MQLTSNNTSTVRKEKDVFPQHGFITQDSMVHFQISC